MPYKATCQAEQNLVCLHEICIFGMLILRTKMGKLCPQDLIYSLEESEKPMDTSLQGANLTLEQVQDLEVPQEAEVTEAEQHIHLPSPSLWPLVLSAAILVTTAGLLGLPDSPLLTIIGTPFILVGILGWALENPMAGHSHKEAPARHIQITSEGARQILERAREIAERSVTVSSTAYSTHVAKVEIEGESPEGVILALYGKVELETQREELADQLRQIPGVLEVKNFMIAEDAILRTAYQRLDAMRAKGKLEGAQNISILVENYILHLYGDVPQKEMKYALEREMVGITGVKVVVNHIGLNKNIPGNLGKTRNA